MPGKAILKESIKKNTVADMQKLGVYKAEYDTIIDIYCEMREQYERLTKEFKDSDYSFKEKTSDGGSKKAPIVATLENLRKDILQYSDRLKLNPKAFTEDAEKGKKKKSKLGAVLSSLDK